MITLGLVLTLDPDHPEISRLPSRLAEWPECSTGSRQDAWLPLAVEALDEEACRNWHDRLAALPGVAFVDVVHVRFNDSNSDSGNS